MPDQLDQQKILVVDDDIKSRKAVASLLNDLDVTVVEVGSGEEVLREVLRQDFLMIILDVRLPGIDGFETAKILRERESSKDIPLIFLTGVDIGSDFAKRGYDLHAVDYMIKPVSSESLRAKVSFFVGHHKKLRDSLVRERQISQERNATNQQLELILDTATNGIVALGTGGKVMSVNPSARHMFGGISDVVPFKWPDTILFLDSKNLQPLSAKETPIARALNGEILRGETHLITRNQGENHRYVRVSSTPINDEISTVRAVLVLDDVSEYELNRQQIERASRLDALGQLTGGIAHDFNNLLATIQYALNLTAQTIGDDVPNQYLDTALGAVERGSALTTRLLAFAKKQPGIARSILVQDVLHDFETLASPTIEKAIEVSFPAVDQDLLVHCDISQLENALLNLVLNSRDAIIRSKSGSSIEVTARAISEIEADATLRAEDPHSYIAKGMHKEHAFDQEKLDGRAYRYIEFSVTDNGPGMTDEVKRRAIDPFFTTKNVNSGTGLGLSMVYGFVQQSDGELRIYSEEGYGTTVRLILPRGTVKGKREEPVARLPQPVGQGETILIAEDEDNLLSMLTGVILSLGYKVVPASSGVEALRLIDDGVEFDLLLTDIVMPGGVGGFDLAHQVSIKRPEAAIVYMSGYTGFSESEMGEVIAPMIQKPSPPSELAVILKKALS